MTWTCSCDAVNESGAAFCEACGKQRAGGVPKSERTGGGLAWSPPTPHVRDLPEPERTGERWVIPPAIQAELDALKAKCVATPSGRRVDPEVERRYLDNLAKRKAERSG